MVEINNLTADLVVDENLLKKVAKNVLKGENRKELDISIGIVGKEEIKRLNRKYRKKNQPTDVLSFFYDNNFGEVVICPQETKDISRVLIHGLLHLAGYDHEKSKMAEDKMRKKEDYYLTFL